LADTDDDHTLKKICEITDGQAFHADSLESLKDVYATLQQQIEVMAGAVLAGLLLNRRLPARLIRPEAAG
jgi:Ca-activated chloride channel homolog